MPRITSYGQGTQFPAFLASALLSVGRFRIDADSFFGLSSHRSLRALHRRLNRHPLWLKWTIALLACGLIGYVDMSTPPEVSFAIFYVLPIAYATWFIRARSGLVVAGVCASLWLLFEVKLGQHVHAWAPYWNATVRMGFFVIGILAVALTKRAAARLLRQVLQSTRSLRGEASRRRKLEHQILEASAREQLRMAQDLHDGVGQYLAALAFLSRMLADDLQREQSAHLTNAERLVELIRKTNQITRRLNRALQIPETRQGGLVSAFRALAAEVEELTGVHCAVVTEQELPALDDLTTVMLFRIVQEAFNNSVKHARPHAIQVHVSFTGYAVSVRVVNDGYTERATETGGTGSLVMRLRAEMIGARLAAGPVADHEYEVACVLPWPGVERHAA